MYSGMPLYDVFGVEVKGNIVEARSHELLNAMMSPDLSGGSYR